MRKRLKEEHRRAVQKIVDFLKEGDFYLAGGTAVYYYLGHRESLDLDFFTKRKIDFRNWKPIFEKFEIMEYTEDTIHSIIEGIKVSFFYYPYELLQERQKLDMIELASLEDILAMKISAILQRGSKKDFVDVYFILKELKMNSEQLIQIFQQKYGNFNPLIIKKALTYFEGADKEGELRMIKSISWDKIKEYFIKKFVEV